MGAFGSVWHARQAGKHNPIWYGMVWYGMVWYVMRVSKHKHKDSLGIFGSVLERLEVLWKRLNAL